MISLPGFPTTNGSLCTGNTNLSPTMSVRSGSSPCVSCNMSNISLPGFPTTKGSLCAGILTAATILPVPEKY